MSTFWAITPNPTTLPRTSTRNWILNARLFDDLERGGAAGDINTELRTISWARFLFSEDDVFKSIGVLSGR